MHILLYLLYFSNTSCKQGPFIYIWNDSAYCICFCYFSVLGFLFISALIDLIFTCPYWGRCHSEGLRWSLTMFSTSRTSLSCQESYVLAPRDRGKWRTSRWRTSGFAGTSSRQTENIFNFPLTRCFLFLWGLSSICQWPAPHPWPRPHKASPCCL